MRKHVRDIVLTLLTLAVLALAAWAAPAEATVPTATNRVEYAGNGVTTNFTVSFPYLAKSEVVVTEISSGGVATTKTLTTHYTLTTPNGASGTVTMLVAPAAGTTLRIERLAPFTQTTNLRTQGDYSAGTLENMADRLTYQTQQLHRRLAVVEDGGVCSPASSSNTGCVTTEAQEFAGNKTFHGQLAAKGLVLDAGIVMVGVGSLTFPDGTTLTTASTEFGNPGAGCSAICGSTTVGSFPVNVACTTNAPGGSAASISGVGGNGGSCALQSTSANTVGGGQASFQSTSHIMHTANGGKFVSTLCTDSTTVTDTLIWTGVSPTNWNSADWRVATPAATTGARYGAFRFASTVNDRWYCCTSNAGADECTDSTVGVSEDTCYNFEIRKVVSGGVTTASWYINGARVCAAKTTAFDNSVGDFSYGGVVAVNLAASARAIRLSGFRFIPLSNVTP